jgi:homoserine O-acetyltransferase/O-succinyltransferase
MPYSRRPAPTQMDEMPTMRSTKILLLLFWVALASTLSRAQQQFATLGDFKLVSGETIRDCRIGYRTKGSLSAEKSNAILVTAWFGGTSEKIMESIGPGKLPDSSKYFVIVIDPIGNGVSSSPSNSTLQPRMKFPEFTIRDMVNSQHEVLTKFLHLDHLKAVMGASMGGMQTFQWIVSFPDFMEKAIPIVGSPQPAAYDLMHWRAENDAIMHDSAWKGGDYTENPGRVQLAEFGALFATTPQYYNKKTGRDDVQAALDKAANEPAMDANDHIRTAQSLIALDVADAFGGSLDKAAAVVKAGVLVVASRQDHTMTAGPALDFAKKIHAEILELNADCGHQLMECQGDKVTRAVTAFLDK